MRVHGDSEPGCRTLLIRPQRIASQQSCHSERTGPQALFSLGVVREESAFRLFPIKAVFGHGENLGGGLHLCNDHQHLGCGCLHHVSGVDETKASISAVILTGKLSFLVQPQAKRTDFPLFVSCGELLCPTLRVILHILRPDLGLFSRLSKMEQTRDQETRNKRECLSVVALRGGVVPPL